MSDYQGNIIIKNPATPTGPSAYGSAPGMWSLNEVAYWIKQGVWPNPAITPDIYFPYVSLLLSTTSLGNANNNLFVDSSGAFNPISRNGNPTQGSFSPYSTNWSNFFAGAGSYIQTPANSATTIVGTLSSTANLTIECWIFPTAYNSSANFPGLIGDMVATAENNNWSWGITNTGTLMLYWNISGTQYRASTTSTVSLNTWTHIALNVAAGAITMYINGVSQSLTGTTTLGTPSGSNNYLVIGQWNNGSGGTGGTSNGLYTGYISNLRVVKASTYTSNFTVPTAPLSAITSTSLLTCQSNRFRDASTNNLTLTVAGSMAVTDFSPFSPAYPGASYNQSDITNWSGYFDGSDYVSFPSASGALGTGDFTVECWYKSDVVTASTHCPIIAQYENNAQGSWAIKASSGSNQCLQFAYYNSGWVDNNTSTNITADRAWHHVAVTRSGTTLRIYADGVLLRTDTIASGVSLGNTGYTLQIGRIANDNAYMTGCVSNARVVAGTALYTGSTYTVPTSPLTAISGTVLLTCQNAAFTDNSTNNFIATQNGNPTVIGNSPFNTAGYWSNYFDGSGDYLSIPSSSSLNFGTGDWTIECWVYVSTRTTNYPLLFGNNRGAWTTDALALTLSNADSASYNDKFVFAWNNGGFSSPSAGTSQLLVANATNSNNTWYHFAAVRNGTSVKMYRNGVEVASATVSAAATFSWGYNGSVS